MTARPPWPRSTALEAPAQADDLVAAYVPANQEPGAELALKMIIERETTASLPDLPMRKSQPLDPGTMQTASLGDTRGLNGLSGMFDKTFSALSGTGKPGR